MDDRTGTPARISSPTATGAAKPPLFRHPARVAIIGATLFVVVALVVGAIASTDTSDLSENQAVPKQVQSYSPAANALVPPTAPIVVDLRDDLIGDLTVCAPTPQDCTPIPFDQVQFIAGLGQITFKPTEGSDLDEYPSGSVTVQVDFRLQGSRVAETGTFSWTFLSKA